MSIPIETPWAVLCPKHGQVFLTEEQYSIQLGLTDLLWCCPVCGLTCEWDDENYEKYLQGGGEMVYPGGE